jgi:hypothetical protein
VEVRAGAAPRAAHVADDLALLHMRPTRHAEAREVRVTGRELARVGDADDVSVAALLPRDAHGAACSRADRCPCRGGDVHPLVVAAPARAEG